MKSWAKICIIFMWGTLAIIVLGAIISLSIPGDVNAPSDAKNVTHKVGWQLLLSSEIINLFKAAYKQEDMAWWYTSSVKDFYHIIGIMATILLVVVPVLGIIFSIVTVKLVNATRFPKSIDFVDAMIDYKKKTKLQKKEQKNLQNLLKKEIITKNEYSKKHIEIENLLSRSYENLNMYKKEWINYKSNYKRQRTFKKSKFK